MKRCACVSFVLVVGTLCVGAARAHAQPPAAALEPRLSIQFDGGPTLGHKSAAFVSVEFGWRLTNKLDVFIEEFSMCHDVPIAGRLDRDPYTIPLAELLLTKLQIVQLNERDQRDIYSLTYHHPMANGRDQGVEGAFIAEICAKDWGLWRTVKATIESCRKNVAGYDIDPEASALISERLAGLWARIEQEPKSAKWRLRSRVGDRMRWYNEPEENL